MKLSNKKLYPSKLNNDKKHYLFLGSGGRSDFYLYFSPIYRFVNYKMDFKTKYPGIYTINKSYIQAGVYLKDDIKYKDKYLNMAIEKAKKLILLK